MKEVAFTPGQQKAIDAGQRHLDACVVAGPGSGKKDHPRLVKTDTIRRLVPVTRRQYPSHAV